jgi:hypothetical protein
VLACQAHARPLQSAAPVSTPLTGRIHNPTKFTMNNGTSETPATARNPRITTTTDELDALKRELMKAEVRLAKARATVVSTEIDIKVINTRLRSFTK